MQARYSITFAAALVLLALTPLAVFAQQLDQTLSGSSAIGHGKWTVTVTAGSSGAPNGFTVWWMKKSVFDANSQQWFPVGNSVQAAMYFDGVPTANTFGGAVTDFLLGPNESVTIELGDLFDETGIYGNAIALQELEGGTEYVFCSWAIGDGSVSASAYSNNVFGSTSTQGEDCQFTQGYWKNHPEAWPVDNLTLGNVNYTKQQLLNILNTPAGGNGILILAHQLIATKLNVANGADPTPVAAAIATADAIIGNLVVPPVGGGYLAPNVVSATSQTLDDFNNGIITTTCNATHSESSTWGRVKSLYR